MLAIVAVVLSFTPAPTVRMPRALLLAPRMVLLEKETTVDRPPAVPPSLDEVAAPGQELEASSSNWLAPRLALMGMAGVCGL